MADDFYTDLNFTIDLFKQTYSKWTLNQVLGLTQWILRREDCPADLASRIDVSLKNAKAAYVLVDGDTFMPISTPEEGAAVEKAINDATDFGAAGPRAHLKASAEYMTSGKYPDSLRESIHAVEATAKLLAPEAKNDALKGALAAVAKKHSIHEAMQKGFANLYGFTSDEKGIRHALLEKGDANVDAINAQYMLGACAAFVSYLLARARERA